MSTDVDDLLDDPLHFFVDKWLEGDTSGVGDVEQMPPNAKVSPLRAWLYERGLLTDLMKALVRQFEAAARRKAPSVDCRVELGRIALSVADDQFRDIMHVLGLLSAGPAPPRGSLDVAVPRGATAQQEAYKALWVRKAVEKQKLELLDSMKQLLLEQELVTRDGARAVLTLRQTVSDSSELLFAHTLPPSHIFDRAVFRLCSRPSKRSMHIEVCLLGRGVGRLVPLPQRHLARTRYWAS